MKLVKFSIMALLVTAVFSVGAAEPQLTPLQTKALKQAHSEVEGMTPDARRKMVFTAESNQCMTTAQAYFELVKDLPEDAFFHLSTKYCFLGGTAAHERDKEAAKKAWGEANKENVSNTVKALLIHSFARGAAIGHQLELDAIEERFFQLTMPDLAPHEYFK